MDLQYTPDRGKTSLLSRLPLLKIALEVKDRRAVSEQDRVGNGETRQTTLLEERTVPAKVISKKDPVAILSDAMTYALEFNGHTVVQAVDPTGDVIIQAHLKKFLSYPIELMDFGPILESAFAMDIEVLTKPDNNHILSKPIRTIYRKQFVFCNRFLHCYTDVLNEGLARFIQSFSADPEVLQALRSVSKKAGP